MVGKNKWTKKYIMSVAGRESARVTFQLMFPFVLRQAQKLGAQAYREGDYKNRMQSFNYVCNALAQRLRKLCHEQAAVRRAEPVGSGLNALVPVDMISAALQEMYGDIKSVRSRGEPTNAQSRTLANKVSLNQQTPAPKTAKQIAK